MARGKILIIEDNALNMELVLAILERINCTAIQATSAEEGIQLAKSQHPSLILMDVNLPGMDGLAAVRLLKQNTETSDIPIIVLTAHAMEGDESKAKEAGCEGYLTKPINVREFMETVSRFMEEKPQTTASAAEEAAAAEAAAQPKSILIVDDEPVNRELLEVLLEQFGYRTVSAEDGAIGLAHLENVAPADAPDLVLLDVMMPGLNGFEVTRAIREHPVYNDLPVVIVTALDSKEDRLRAVEAGANDFIAKPIDRAELQVRVNSLLKMKAAQDNVKQQRGELEQAVKQRTLSLQQALQDVTTARNEADKAHLDTIYRLAVASEYRDTDTAVHIRRVGSYCGLLGRYLDLPKDEVDILIAASPMHDVGKLGIPDSILLKPGPLDPEEWAIMKEHTTIGARILSGSSSKLLNAGEVIALTHHERWDGSGYPNRLAGSAIPLWGRICALADVFDALTNERPYKKAFTNEQAWEIMREQRGRHFDPKLLDLFLQLKNEIVAIQAKYSETPETLAAANKPLEDPNGYIFSPLNETHPTSLQARVELSTVTPVTTGRFEKWG